MAIRHMRSPICIVKYHFTLRLDLCHAPQTAPIAFLTHIQDLRKFTVKPPYVGANGIRPHYR
ncbi:MAG: hypothetical protein SWX82_13385 [Cyanobacteriota bacterium]|nr:hypothetical protein [Cyanobacteriota bacterium]